MQIRRILRGVDINRSMSIEMICDYIITGLNELQEILDISDITNKYDENVFKNNLDILKRFYEKLERTIRDSTNIQKKEYINNKDIIKLNIEISNQINLNNINTQIITDNNTKQIVLTHVDQLNIDDQYNFQQNLIQKIKADISIHENNKVPSQTIPTPPAPVNKFAKLPFGPYIPENLKTKVNVLKQNESNKKIEQTETKIIHEKKQSDTKSVSFSDLFNEPKTLEVNTINLKYEIEQNKDKQINNTNTNQLQPNTNNTTQVKPNPEVEQISASKIMSNKYRF